MHAARGHSNAGRLGSQVTAALSLHMWALSNTSQSHCTVQPQFFSSIRPPSIKGDPPLLADWPWRPPPSPSMLGLI